MDKIEAGYQKYNKKYDDFLTSRGFLTTLYNKIVWGLQDNDYVQKVLSYIPDSYNGTILDVPVGTGVHTYKRYNQLENAKITALDYSSAMLDQAEKRMGKYQNVTLMQGDVSNLPFEAETFDMILSMNGFHAFPDKRKAFEETFRVLKKEGVFIGCFYIKGERLITDRFVNTLYVEKGWFTPPFYTLDQLHALLEKQYQTVFLSHVKSIAYFYCRKTCA